MSDWEDDPEPPKPTPVVKDWGQKIAEWRAGGGGNNNKANDDDDWSGVAESIPKPKKTGGFNRFNSSSSSSSQQQQRSGPMKCNKCGGVGHKANVCPSVDVDTWDDGFVNGGGAGGGGGGRQSGGDSSKYRKQNNDSVNCFKCNKPGHWSRECPNGGGLSVAAYVPDPEIGTDDLFELRISTGINFDKYGEIKCKVTPEDLAPEPITKFEDEKLGLQKVLVENIRRSHYLKPTPVQSYAIPIIMGGNDLMACAQTGSGKTAAFLLPVIHKLLETGVEPMPGSSAISPQVLIVAPTRELGIQIKEESRKFCAKTGLKSQVIYGGVSVQYQVESLTRHGCNILTATPGRLIDFVAREVISFSNIKFLILDEADRMLDMGFMGDIEEIVRHISMPAKEERQTLMFSATFPDKIQKLAREFLNNYLFLSVGLVGGACTDVTQAFFQVEKFQKMSKLREILKEVKEFENEKTLIFVREKKSADFIASMLCQSDFAATSIHGDRLQREREIALRSFKTGKKPILVATEVAARGLDIPNVAHVINYDLPQEIETYVHRIGRTGRVGNTGRATSFFDSGQDGALAKDLVKILSDAEQEVPDWLAKEASNYGGGASGGGGGSRSKFGGKDIRFNGNSGGGSGGGETILNGGASNHLEDEMWD